MSSTFSFINQTKVLIFFDPLCNFFCIYFCDDLPCYFWQYSIINVNFKVTCLNRKNFFRTMFFFVMYYHYLFHYVIFHYVLKNQHKNQKIVLCSNSRSFYTDDFKAFFLVSHLCYVLKSF